MPEYGETMEESFKEQSLERHFADEVKEIPRKLVGLIALSNCLTK